MWIDMTLPQTFLSIQFVNFTRSCQIVLAFNERDGGILVCNILIWSLILALSRGWGHMENLYFANEMDIAKYISL